VSDVVSASAGDWAYRMMTRRLGGRKHEPLAEYAFLRRLSSHSLVNLSVERCGQASVTTFVRRVRAHNVKGFVCLPDQALLPIVP